MQSTTYSSDDKLMAALAHTGLVWVILPLIIYFIKKDQSPWVGKQSLQATIYQVVVIVVTIILFIVVSICAALTAGIGGILMCIIWLIPLAGWIYGLYGAYQCYQGVDFKYPYLYDMINK